ncbi:unnamed protein product [Phytophthora fragariaefolia]|uniref:Unnamed protein product n=1 Tax=Phytophthora fragariaefolia TaxID=1490495 RepID=A0A9W6U2F4_9STRA|nr:unnamed protein product [Phytophthora fragariaefolia]
MKLAAIAVAIACFVSFVVADQPSLRAGTEVSSAPMSADERMQLAKTMKEMISNNPGSVDPAIANMSTEDLFGLLSSVISNPAVLSHVGGLISAATSGNTGALAGHAAGLLGAVVPGILPSAQTPAPLAAAPST